MDTFPEPIGRPGDISSPHGVASPSLSLLITVQIRLYREGLAQNLARFSHLDVAGTAASTGEAVAALRNLRPEIMLLDLGMDDAPRLVRQARETAPDTRLVALGVYESENDVLACAEAGIVGYVPHDASLADLVAVVESAANGELRCSPRIAAALFRRAGSATGRRQGHDRASLTVREREVAELLEEGVSNKEISRRLQIEISTVKHHVHNVLTKLQLPRRSLIAAAARQRQHGSG